MTENEDLGDIVNKEAPKYDSKPSVGSKFTKAGIATAVGYAITGVNAPLSGLAFMLGSYLVDKKRKVKAKFGKYLDDFSVGTYMGIIGSSMYDWVNRSVQGVALKAQLTRAALAAGPINWIFNTLYHVVEPIVKYGKHAGEKIAEGFGNLWQDMKNTTKYLGIPLSLTINGYMGGYPGIVASDAAYRYIVGKK